MRNYFLVGLAHIIVLWSSEPWLKQVYHNLSNQTVHGSSLSPALSVILFVLERNILQIKALHTI